MYGDSKIEFDFPLESKEERPYSSNNESVNSNMDERNDPPKSVWSLPYYQQFFEVSTDQVITRVTWAMFPKPGVNFFKQFIQSNPDLYGPFWICLTLVFTVAIGGNVGSYLQTAATGPYHWKYDFHLLTFAATTIFSYTWLLPLVLWGVLKWQSNDQVNLSYLELTCVYGYCLTVFIPISILWVIPVTWLQWTLVLTGAALSGTVLLKSLVPMVGNMSWIFVIVISSLHFLLSFSLMNPYSNHSPLPPTLHNSTVF